ncbi:MAG: hypothetical protein ACP5M0_14795, partial [Desulfomonilaceae bacterium]
GYMRARPPEPRSCGAPYNSPGQRPGFTRGGAWITSPYRLQHILRGRSPTSLANAMALRPHLPMDATRPLPGRNETAGHAGYPGRDSGAPLLRGVSS